MEITNSSWVPIPEYDKHLINEQGEIFSLNVNRKLEPWNEGGYLRIGLTKSNKTKFYLVHRLLAVAFLGLPNLESDLEVDHIDTDPLNNTLSNLQILTKESHLRKTLLDKGHSPRGAAQYCTKCNTVLSFNNSSLLCSKCKPINIKEQEIVAAVLELKSWVKAGEKFGLSDNGLRKVYKRVSNGKDPKLVKKNK